MGAITANASTDYKYRAKVSRNALAAAQLAVLDAAVTEYLNPPRTMTDRQTLLLESPEVADVGQTLRPKHE